MIILHFIRSWVFWLPLVVLLLVELCFRAGLWEPFVLWDSHAGQTVMTKRSLERIDRLGIEYITLGNSTAREGLDHKQLARLALSHHSDHINLSLPGSHFLTFKTLERYAAAQLPNLKGVLLITPAAFLQAMGNGEYELSIVRPLQAYTGWQEQMLHVNFRHDSLASWSSLSSFVGYRDDVAGWLKSMGQGRDLVQHHEPGRWWFEWTANDAENICWADEEGVAIQSTAQLCPIIEASGGSSDMADTMRQFCRMPVLAEVISPQDLEYWRSRQLPGIRQAWEDYLRDMGARYRLVILSLPVPEIYRQRRMIDEITAASYALLQRLSDEGVLHWLDLRSLPSSMAVDECALFRDPWHLNVKGQRGVTERVAPFLQKVWYDNLPAD